MINYFSVAPLDEGDYSPVDDESSAQNSELHNSVVGKVQKTVDNFNNLATSHKISNGADVIRCERETTSKSLRTGMINGSNSKNLEICNGKNPKELMNGSVIGSGVDSGVGQLSSNSISGTSVSGSISSSNSSSSTSPQDSHNDSGYSTRVGYSAGPSPSLSGTVHIIKTDSNLIL